MKNIILISIFIALAGCSSAMIEHEFQPVYIFQEVEDKTLFIEKSIVRACIDRKWIPEKIEDGKINASIVVRGTHKITVLIEYNESGFEMSPVSTNMSRGFGRVHGKYNKWVANLHRQISKQIMRS